MTKWKSGRWAVFFFSVMCWISVSMCHFAKKSKKFSPKMLQVFGKSVHHIFYCWGVFRNVPLQCYAQMKEFDFEFRVLLWPIRASGNVQSWIEIRILWNAWRQTLRHKSLICESNSAAVGDLSEGLNLSPTSKSLDCRSVSMTLEKLWISEFQGSQS